MYHIEIGIFDLDCFSFGALYGQAKCLVSFIRLCVVLFFRYFWFQFLIFRKACAPPSLHCSRSLWRNSKVITMTRHSPECLISLFLFIFRLRWCFGWPYDGKQQNVCRKYCHSRHTCCLYKSTSCSAFCLIMHVGWDQDMYLMRCNNS